MPIARYISIIRAPVRRVFGFHEAPDAFARLLPPWQPAEVIQPPASLEVGTVVIVRMRLAPLVWVKLVAEHVGYEKDHFFIDRQREGPFAAWRHRHLFEPVDGGAATELTDEITYALPLGPLGQLGGGWFARRQLDRLFRFRHEVTRRACEG
jgi:ligand-binding SRPBCC domain-containing protein